MQILLGPLPVAFYLLLVSLLQQKMMLHSNTNLVGIASGPFLSVLPNLKSEDILRTILLATLGLIVSFLIFLFLKIGFKKHKN